MSNPYTDHKGLDGFVRVFSYTVDESELIWHMDHKNRTVEVLSGDGWALQLDDCMPVSLSVGYNVQIPRDTFHRLLKGSGDLTVWIVED